MPKKLLMIFVRNPELGKVKTRLAKTVGDKRALEVYNDLLKYTRDISIKCSSEKAVFYSHFIDDFDGWSNVLYQKFVQEGINDLGVRMQNAFKLAFEKGYNRVVIIGSDCLEISTHDIEEAFFSLEKKDVIVGPAKDGGYYLLGMNKLHLELFKNKTWSSENVLSDTLLDIEKLNLTYHLLDILSDVDYEDDLKQIEV
jgi:uncharacterized protein